MMKVTDVLKEYTVDLLGACQAGRTDPCHRQRKRDRKGNTNTIATQKEQFNT